jgi:hypothetical protein
MTLLLILFIVYSLYTHRVYIINESEGNHRWAAEKFYKDLETGVYKSLSNSWSAKGRERYLGFFGAGTITCSNSFRRPTVFKYFSVMIRIPNKVEVGIDFGTVSGYEGYKKTGLKIGDKLIAVVPKIRYANPSFPETAFVAHSQFGSASIDTSGWVQKSSLYNLFK